MNGTSDVLPYRVDPEDLERWVDARVHGRAASHARERSLPARSADGIGVAAVALGLARPDLDLTPRGAEFALLAAGARRVLVREGIFEFPPYRDLLAEVSKRGHSVTESGWIEAWWATRNVGNSPSNRQEGAAALGRLAEYADLGRYIAGRRGHPTRIEWNRAALLPPVRAATPPPPEDAQVLLRSQATPRSPVDSDSATGTVRPPGTEVHGDRGSPGSNHVVISLVGGRRAEFDVPARLPRGEKRRLLDLVDLLIEEE